jgi:23S rRNA pseudouridine2604 synthase
MKNLKPKKQRVTKTQRPKPSLTPEPASPLYPMRINKYLALKNYATRRGADDLVEKGQVFINNSRAILGDKVNENDKVEVHNRGKAKEYIYLAYNKPRGIITHSPQHGEREAKQDIPIRDVFPVGRLDKDSTGLLILTNDGRVTDRLLNPKHAHDKEYIVTTKNNLRSSFKAKMEAGVKIENEMTKPCKVDIINENTFRITLGEGKKHQIRRMCVALFQEVDTLKRVRIMNIILGKIEEGSYRKIAGEELKAFLKSLGLTQ